MLIHVHELSHKYAVMLSSCGTCTGFNNTLEPENTLKQLSSAQVTHPAVLMCRHAAV